MQSIIPWCLKTRYECAARACIVMECYPGVSEALVTWLMLLPSVITKHPIALRGTSLLFVQKVKVGPAWSLLLLQ